MNYEYEHGKVKNYLQHENFKIVSMYSGYNFDGNRCSFVGVEIGFDVVEIVIDNRTGRTEKV